MTLYIILYNKEKLPNKTKDTFVEIHFWCRWLVTVVRDQTQVQSADMENHGEKSEKTNINSNKTFVY